MFPWYYHVITIWNIIYTNIKTVHSLLLSVNLDLMVANNEIVYCLLFIVLFAKNYTNQIKSNYLNSHGEKAQEKPPGL